MDSTYNEFQGTDLDQSADYDFDFDEDEGNGLLPILGASALAALAIGGALLIIGRKRNPTPEERIQEVIHHLEKSGKKGAKAATRTVTEAVHNGKLGDLLSEAIDKAHHLADDAGHAVEHAKLGDLLDEALSQARKATDRLDLEDIGKNVQRGVKKATKDIDLGDIGSSVGDAVGRARKAASQLDVEETMSNVRKRAGDAVDSVRDMNLDASGAANLLDTLKEKLGQAIESVRDEIAPKAVDNFKSDVLPAAQDMAENVSKKVREDILPAAQDMAENVSKKVREDVLPAAQERASQLIDDAEVGKHAKQAAQAAREGVGSFSEMMRGIGVAVLHKVMDEVLPEAKKAGGKAVIAAREEIIPAAAENISNTVGDAAQTLREDVLPKVGDAVSQAPDMLGDMLKMARDHVGEALDKAQPAASDALETGKNKAGDLVGTVADSLRGGGGAVGDKVGGVVGSVTDTLGHGKDNVTGAVSSAGQNVKGAVGSAVDVTTHATKQASGILFWFAMLGGLILLVFVPDRDRQKEIWNGIQQFLGELREMWRDLQGQDYELEAPDERIS